MTTEFKFSTRINGNNTLNFRLCPCTKEDRQAFQDAIEYRYGSQVYFMARIRVADGPSYKVVLNTNDKGYPIINVVVAQGLGLQRGNDECTITIYDVENVSTVTALDDAKKARHDLHELRTNMAGLLGVSRIPR